MTDFSTAPDTVNALAAWIGRTHPPYVGAQFRFAVRPTDRDFLTGRVTFCPRHIPSRPPADYKVLRFVDYWCGGQEEALGLLSKLLSGQAEFDGMKIGATFHRSQMTYDSQPIPPTMWSGMRVLSQRDRGAEYRETALPQLPMVGFGVKPYLTVAQGVNDRIFDHNSIQDWYSNSIPHENTLTTILPDPRARVLSARWSPGKLKVQLEVNLAKEEVELQVVHRGLVISSQTQPAVSGNHELQVPDTSREIFGYLVHSSGHCITKFHLSSVYESFDESGRSVTVEDRAIVELARGENEQVEFKPFISPGHSKQNEVLESVVAFANGGGGRIYIGVLDRNGIPEGETALRKAFHDEPEAALKKLTDYLRQLLTNHLKPVPDYEVSEIYPFGVPAAVISVAAGKERPYSNQNNDIFVRRGATNRRPDANELESLLKKEGKIFRLD